MQAAGIGTNDVNKDSGRMLRHLVGVSIRNIFISAVADSQRKVPRNDQPVEQESPQLPTNEVVQPHALDNLQRSFTRDALLSTFITLHKADNIQDTFYISNVATDCSNADFLQLDFSTCECDVRILKDIVLAIWILKGPRNALCVRRERIQLHSLRRVSRSLSELRIHLDFNSYLLHFKDGIYTAPHLVVIAPEDALSEQGENQGLHDEVQKPICDYITLLRIKNINSCLLDSDECRRKALNLLNEYRKRFKVVLQKRAEKQSLLASSLEIGNICSSVAELIKETNEQVDSSDSKLKRIRRAHEDVDQQKDYKESQQLQMVTDNNIDQNKKRIAELVSRKVAILRRIFRIQIKKAEQLHAICGVVLSSGDERCSVENISAALGYVSLLVSTLFNILSVPPIHPVVFFGSQSFIIDNNRIYPLYPSRGSEDLLLGLSMLSKDVEELFGALKMRKTGNQKILESLDTVLKSLEMKNADIIS